MRLSAITGSIVFHSALVAASFTLPIRSERLPNDPVTVDLFARKKEAPKVAPIPMPAEPPKLAMREPPRPAAPRERPVEVTPPPEPAHAPPPSSEPPAARPPGKIDLTLHALPPGDPSGTGATVPPSTGTFGTDPNGTGRRPWKMRGDAGNPLTGKLADEPEDRFPLKAVGGGEYEYKGKAFSAVIGRDGRVRFDDKSIRDFKGLSGGFDITDLLMRAKGNDPYRAEKKAFLDTTEGMRKKMAQAALKERMLASLGGLPAQLDEIWRNPRTPPMERRRLLYETWRDAAASEAEIGDSAKEACSIVENYVRRYLPPGGEDSYTDGELERLNRGQRWKFQPYR